MPMVPELPITMLACARLGVIHSQVFSGFSGKARAERIVDSGSQSVIREIGAIARPRRIVIVPDMPKTRSGKIMRRGALPS
jgi:acyl-coenzyme A synthetase/AMP-(fatty) acid ligase